MGKILPAIERNLIASLITAAQLMGSAANIPRRNQVKKKATILTATHCNAAPSIAAANGMWAWRISQPSSGTVGSAGSLVEE
jgi:hypothetical protein